MREIARYLVLPLKLVGAVVGIVFLPVHFAYPLLAAIGAVQEEKFCCRKCGSGNLCRTKREGAWQLFASRWFHLYPWECISCRHVLLYRRRGSRLKRLEKWLETADMQEESERQDLGGVGTRQTISHRVA